MSQREPSSCYVYQPDPDKPGELDPKIFAVGGPGSEKYQGKRFTRADATAIAESLNRLKHRKRD
jgi:hypothetical protein